MAQRIALYDNLKGFAIILVVVGHLTTRGSVFDSSHLLQASSTFIYLFHMPLFIFCSGLFAGKAWYKARKAPADKFLLYLALYLIFCAGVAVFDLVLCGHAKTINPFVIGAAPWFMLVLSLYMLLVPIMGSVNPIAFMTVSIFIAAASGACLDNPNTLALSRTFVYLPYFAAAFYLQPERVKGFVDTVKGKIPFAQILALALLVVLFVGLYTLSNTQLVTIRAFSSGMNLFGGLAESTGLPIAALCALRVADYFVVAIVLAVVILAIPEKECVLTGMGERSFQVYIAHMFIMYTFDVTGCYGAALAWAPWVVYAPFVVGPLLTWLLAFPKTPNEWVKNLGKLCKKITEEKKPEHA